MPNEMNAAGQSAEKYTARSFIIVARDQQELWRALTREFNHIPEIQILLDRRQTERRQMVLPVVRDRRAAQRRSLTQLEDDLRARQYVLVRPCHLESRE